MLKKMIKQSNKFYITTPLYYVNDKPHIGHAYTTILADVIARIQTTTGKDVYFLTGTDEHGQKVQEASKKRNVDCKEHVDEYVLRFKSLWKELNINFDFFMRTTYDFHKENVQVLLNKLWNSGDIYMDEYEGLYSVSEERFVTQKEVDEGDFREVITLKEKNYFFKMSKYQQDLIEHINNNDSFILPSSRRNEILGFLDKPLKNLCISRPKSRLSWGIEIPFDNDYVTYVWFDALLNYVTALGMKDENGKFSDFWPASLHLIGKDILTTHCVYWPTMLMAIGLKLPKTILAHGWWMSNEDKMSKSIGNVVDPLEIINKHGSDALRFYLMRNMVVGMDSNYSYESFVERYNSDLANDYGNLINRITMLIKKNFDNRVPPTNKLEDLDRELISNVNRKLSSIQQTIKNLKIHNLIENSISTLRLLNKYLEVRAPWKLVKQGEEEIELAATTLSISANILVLSSKILNPIMPKKTKLILNIFNTNCNKISNKIDPLDQIKPNTKLKNLNSPFFPRIDNESN